MKAVLEYNLNDSDDAMAHLRAVKSLDMALVLWEVMYNIRKGIEWDIESGKYKDQNELLDAIIEKINSYYDEHGIIIDELVN